jgi:signal transduction histidine kinase
VEKATYLRKLHDIFLRKFLFLFSVLFLILGIVIYLWIKHIYIEQTKKNLLDNINIVSLSIKNLSDLTDKAKVLRGITHLRITFIDQNGTILGESDKDPKTMDNHINRREIIDANFKEYGYSIRTSDTVKKELLYVAKKFSLKEHDYYIRISADIQKINDEFLYLSFKIGLLFLFFIMIAFFIAVKTSQNIQKEIQDIVHYLSRIKKHQKIKINTNPFSVEFSKIITLLEDVSNSLSKKERQKSKYTARLKLANRQKDDIISAISHEFKNPIAVISGYSQTLLDDKDLNADIRENFLTKINSNSLKLSHLIDRLRLSMKLEEGNYEESFTKTNLYSLTKQIIEDIKLTYPNREITLIGEKNVSLEIDETMMRVAIENLIENALKYSQDDVMVSIKNNELSVIDTGIGIKEKDISKITNRFYRASKNSWNNSLGIGLSLVSSVLKIHKFSLDIQSIENEGSTFTIVFK